MRWVGGPTDAGTVIGAPDPGVVDDGVVAVDLEVVPSAADASTAYAEEDVVERDRVLCVGGFSFARAYLEEDGGLSLAGVEEESGDDDAVRVCCGHGGVAVDGVQSGEAEAHYDSVGAGDVDGFGEVVGAGG